MELSEQQEKEIDNNIKLGILRLSKFITPTNGFTYWPGRDNYYNTWANSYAGHFMVEAKNANLDKRVSRLQLQFSDHITT